VPDAQHPHRDERSPTSPLTSRLTLRRGTRTATCRCPRQGCEPWRPPFDSGSVAGPRQASPSFPTHNPSRLYTPRDLARRSRTHGLTGDRVSPGKGITTTAIPA
jgi:hypothetical protein